MDALKPRASSPPRPPKPENIYGAGPSNRSNVDSTDFNGSPFNYLSPNIADQSVDIGHHESTNHGISSEPRDSVTSQSPIIPMEKGKCSIFTYWNLRSAAEKRNRFQTH